MGYGIPASLSICEPTPLHPCEQIRWQQGASHLRSPGLKPPTGQAQTRNKALFSLVTRPDPKMRQVPCSLE